MLKIQLYSKEEGYADHISSPPPPSKLAIFSYMKDVHIAELNARYISDI